MKHDIQLELPPLTQADAKDLRDVLEWAITQLDGEEPLDLDAESRRRLHRTCTHYSKQIRDHLDAVEKDIPLRNEAVRAVSMARPKDERSQITAMQEAQV